MKFIEPEHLPEDLVATVKMWQWEKPALYGLHLSLKEPPKYDVAPIEPAVNNALLQVMGNAFENVEEFIKHFNQTIEGTLSEPSGHATCITIFDTSQAPPNMHVGRWECLAPYEAKDGQWDTLKDVYAERCL